MTKSKSEILEEVSEMIQQLEIIIDESAENDELGESFITGLGMALSELTLIQQGHSQEKPFAIVATIKITQALKGDEHQYRLLVTANESMVTKQEAAEIAAFYGHNIEDVNINVNINVNQTGYYIANEGAYTVSVLKIEDVDDGDLDIISKYLPIRNLYHQQIKHWRTFMKRFESLV